MIVLGKGAAGAALSFASIWFGSGLLASVGIVAMPEGTLTGQSPTGSETCFLLPDFHNHGEVSWKE